MTPFTTLTAKAAPLEIAKIDTGMIVPGRFQRIRRRAGHTDYAQVFLHDLRFDEKNRPRADFVLNQPAFQGAKILVTGPDFGCGSSRESAAYAVLDYGVRALIGPSFGDVFVGNCMQNGIVPVVLPMDTVQSLWRQIKAAPGVEMTVSLIEQTVSASDGAVHRFEIDATRRERLMKGLDDVGVTLEHLAQIEAFEARYSRDKPWLPRTA
ncbi:MAG TPA: 3-isopropylmalate dehydratase small subunit [Burkholderiales bacterium]|nr:3-isopropylmalate dehydratase small subunit [Burkholderiales bacterium]